MSIEHPEIGETQRGKDIGKGKNDYKYYMWVSCNDCGKTSWKITTYGKPRSIYCSSCAHAHMVKNRIYPKLKGHLGFIKVHRDPIQHEPQIGEIRYGDEIGKYGNHRYIFHACTICGKTRWVAYSKNAPVTTKCIVCSKLGSIRIKSLNDYRKCSKCGNEYPSTKEYFYKATRSYRGISCVCKKCKNKQNSNYATNYRKNNIKIRLHTNVSKSIARSLNGTRKGKKWEELVGYTKQELMAHLEKQFHDGMSWDNYGINGWGIDHIIPKDAFCFNKPTDLDFKRCWALSNLQPMYVKENILKSNHVDKPFQPSLPLGISERKLQYVS